MSSKAKSVSLWWEVVVFFLGEECEKSHFLHIMVKIREQYTVGEEIIKMVSVLKEKSLKFIISFINFISVTVCPH